MSFGSGPRRAALVMRKAEGQMGQNQTLRDFGQKIPTECQRGGKKSWFCSSGTKSINCCLGRETRMVLTGRSRARWPAAPGGPWGLLLPNLALKSSL